MSELTCLYCGNSIVKSSFSRPKCSCGETKRFRPVKETERDQDVFGYRYSEKAQVKSTDDVFGYRFSPAFRKPVPKATRPEESTWTDHGEVGGFSNYDEED